MQKTFRHLSPVAVLLSLALGGCASSSSGEQGVLVADNSESAAFEKIEERQVARDQGIYHDTQARIADLNARKGVRIDNYALAKAQCWLDVSFHEYTRNDRGGFPRAALEQAQGILTELEAGHMPDVSETPLVNGARRLREDLWQRFAVLKARPEGMQCAAARLACAEVELVHAGNEIRQGGWRHASPYIQMAEDMTADAERLAAQCGTATPPAPAAEVVAEPALVSAVSRLEVRFKFDRHGVEDILPEDRQKLVEFVEELNGQFERVDSLNLLGHADRLGARDYNTRLSLQRALTVRAELQRLGVAWPISVVPMGATEAFSSGCHAEHQGRDRTVQCLQPDRRVSIEVVGARRR